MKNFEKYTDKFDAAKKSILTFLPVLAIFLFSVSGAYAFTITRYFAPSINRPVEIAGGEIIVKSSDIQKINAALGTSVIQGLNIENTYRLRIPAGETVESILKKISSTGAAEYAEPNYIVKAFAVPVNDPQYSSQYALSKIAWDTAFINRAVLIPAPSPVIIAIVDSGVDWTHPDLAAAIQFSTGEILGDGIDNDGNGYVDDYYGFNALSGQSEPSNATATQDAEYALSEKRPFDTTGHGTLVAGIAAAVVNNGIGTAGVCWSTNTYTIMSVKVLDSSYLPLLGAVLGSGSSAAVASGIIYAAKNGARVINLSLGNDVPAMVEKDAIDYAVSKGCVVVAASGDDDASVVSYPAAFDNVIAVGATNSSDRRCSQSDWGVGLGSNYGAALDVVAPGNAIMSTYAVFESTAVGYFAPTYQTELSTSGTSMSSAFVAGLAALIISQNPSFSPSDVEKRIEGSCDDLQSVGWDSETGWGRINVLRALRALPADINPIYAAPAKAKAFPNPFYVRRYGKVTIQLPEKNWGDHLKVSIYNFSGTRVRFLDDTAAETTPTRGLAVWDGKNDNGDIVASGLYFYVADTGGEKIRGKITLIK